MSATTLTVAAFDEYICAFNEKRYDDMIRFYADDVALELPAAGPTSPAGIKAHYERLHAICDEWLRVDWIMLGDAKIAIEVYTEFFAREAHPGFSMKPLEKGELFRCTNMVHYDLDDEGRFSHIRVGRYVVHEGQV